MCGLLQGRFADKITISHFKLFSLHAILASSVK